MVERHPNSNAVKMPLCMCPACGYVINAATPSPGSRRNAVPKPRDITLCLRCAAILMYDDAMTPRRLSGDEMAQLAVEQPRQMEHVRQEQRRVVVFNLLHPRPPPIRGRA
jgi:hypothetical protein